MFHYNYVEWVVDFFFIFTSFSSYSSLTKRYYSIISLSNYSFVRGRVAEVPPIFDPIGIISNNKF